MKPKRLEWMLSDLRSFENPNISLEQYATSPELARIDIDEYALSICKENLELLDVEQSCDLVQADVLQLPNSMYGQFDVVITNPPFGTKKNAGMDMQFVRAGLEMLRIGGSLFSLHKSSTRDYILKTANKWTDTDARCVAELRWNLESTYKFHKKKSVDIAVDLIHYKKV
ncbi:unnamed protein product [Nippostrongylus brasiliensis]|uniref:Methyltransferase-like protein 5 n=1 Tax=Nippostrongylus brasiliensis TaxID=27835 RepID=A0A0N4YP42_NIPBR|nr:unnamed protein product [Nippostrongylus brasiliensis]